MQVTRACTRSNIARLAASHAGLYARLTLVIVTTPPTEWEGTPTPNRVLAQDLDEPCAGKSGAVLCGFYGVHTDKIYRRIGGFRVVVMQKHAETRSKCHFEAIWGPAGQTERRRTSFVYHAWAVTTCIEAFVLLVAALAPFTSFAAGAARPLADYQRWNS